MTYSRANFTLAQNKAFEKAWMWLRKGYPELADYDVVISYLFYLLIDDDIKIVYEPGRKTCEFKVERERDKPKPIRKILVCTEPRDEQSTVIWSLYHEYGHALQDPPGDAERECGTPERYIREQEAWNKAEELLLTWSDFKNSHLNNFYQFRNHRLKSYEPKPNH